MTGNGEDQQPTVLAVVLTYESRQGLAECLEALRGQSRPLDGTLVVDNASSEPVDDLVAAMPNGRVLRLEQNLGPAGGHAAGLAAFLTSANSFAWVMDDDCQPRSDALAALLAAGHGGRTLVLARAIDAEGGAHIRGIGWWGVLIPRAAVAQVGLPNADLFWWTEDNEYLGRRIPRGGFSTRRCEDAIVTVARGRSSPSKPAWKYFYEARNEVYHRLWTQQADGVRPVRHHLKLRVRVWRASRATMLLAVRALVIERDQRARKVWLVLRGAYDGVIRRLGRTIPADEAHRPSRSRDQ